MKEKAVKLFFALLLTAAFIYQTNAQTISVNASLNKTYAKRGTVAKGTITLTIPIELHINSNKPSSEFLLPTIVKISGKRIKNIRLLYPKGIDKKFEFSEEKLNVYEGKTVIRFNFIVPKNLKTNRIQIKAKVNYQACSDEVCYQPQEKIILLNLKVF